MRVIDRGQRHTFSYSTIGFPYQWEGWDLCHHLCSIGDHLAPLNGTNQLGSKYTPCQVYQRYDRVKWSGVPGSEVTVLYHILGPDPFEDEHWLFQMLSNRRPMSTILVFVDAGNVLFSEQYRRKVKQVGDRGFWTFTWSVCDSEVGASCRQSHTVTVCGLRTKIAPPDITFFEQRANQRPRPSDNHLAHHTIGRGAYTPSHLVQRVAQPSVMWRGLINNEPVYGPGVCLPCVEHLWVETPKGCRRVQPKEWMSMKGYASVVTPFAPTVLFEVPSQHLWATLGDALLQLLSNPIPSEQLLPSPRITLSGTAPVDGGSGTDTSELLWRPPSFSKRGRWYRERVSNLRKASQHLSNAAEVIEEGLHLLSLHRQNYSEEGPKHLVLLWWEWPPEHHEELRTGLSMNFLSTPPPGILPNAPMNAEERDTAVRFVDELLALGVLEPEPAPGNVVNTCPLFLVPKPGQPGQYRCIADMKKGGQNACVGADPVQMTSPNDILPCLYQGGYSATLDIAKYFHMFPTIESERCFLGCIHPATDEMLRYRTLPMGAGNSPGASGRYGAVFLRLVTTTLPAFKGRIVRNDIAAGFAGEGFQPRLGIGRVLIGEDGLPVCILWIHVDDLLIHGPTKEMCTAGLHQLLELTVRLGFICQRCKTVPPCQRVKYCGFLYDTVDVPKMLIPTDKITRALGQVAYVRRPDVPLSRLGLAISVGNLQSLVPATPNNIIASFLRHLYSDLHATQGKSYASHLAFYYDTVSLSPLGQLDLTWWSRALVTGVHSRCVPCITGLLGVAWGDGSGSGTGGTFEWVAPDKGPLPVMNVWMGSWSPSVHRFSSNWRELRTLVATLHPEEQGVHDIENKHLFYFTDNSTVYHITRSGSSSSPELHRLLQQLKLLELSRGCCLEVIHVPGRTMIAQGTDGQSRGVWVSPLQDLSRNVTADLFRPAPPSEPLLAWLLQQIPSPLPAGCYRWITDESCWTADNLLHRHCVWSLYPTTARQGFLAAVFAWIESPSDSSHIFLVPRLLQRDFGRVNKHILYLGQFETLPLPSDFSPLVPFLVYYLPPYVRSIKHRLDDTPWLDSGPKCACPEWVRTQMEYLCGLSGSSPP